MKAKDLLDFFFFFLPEFQPQTRSEMLEALHISVNDRLKTMSKGHQGKVQLILVMSRDAKLYVLDEPIGGVDPAAAGLYPAHDPYQLQSPTPPFSLPPICISDIENYPGRGDLPPERRSPHAHHRGRGACFGGEICRCFIQEVFRC